VASSESAVPYRREVLRPAMPRLLCRCHLQLHHLQDLLASPVNAKIIILNDFDEEKYEARKEKSVSAKDVAASSAANPISTASADDVGTPTEKSLTPAASPPDADEDPGAVPNDSSDGLAPGPKMGEGSGGRDEAGTPQAAAPRTVFMVGVLQKELRSALLPLFLLCAKELGW
jgi:hypothetical protein